MCSRSCGTPLWYLLLTMAERQRDPTVGGKKCFSQKQDMWRVTLQQLLEASGAMDACTVVPQVHSSTPPSALACLILYPIQYVCFAPISAPLFSHSITICLHIFSTKLCPKFAPPFPHSRYLHPSASLVSRLTTCPPCLRFALSDLPPGVRMGRETTTEALMHLPWQDLDLSVLKSTFHDSWLERYGITGHTQIWLWQEVIWQTEKAHWMRLK